MRKTILILLLVLCSQTCKNPYLPPIKEIQKAKSKVLQSKLPFLLLALPVLQGSDGKAGVFPHLLPLASKTIKKLNFHLIPYNLVGDSLKSFSPPHTSLYSLKMGGPIQKSEDPIGLKVEDIWENDQIHCIRLNSVEIVYDNYEIELIEEPEKLKTMAPFSKCPE